MEKPGFVYITASARNGTISLGATSDLAKRAWEHRTGLIRIRPRARAPDEGMEARLKVREIEGLNPDWNDFYETVRASA